MVTLTTLEPRPPIGRRRVRNRTAKQQALLGAAQKLFAERGFDAATTREIAAAAGCAEGLIHRYFNGKAGLLFALLQPHREADGADEIPPLSPGLEDEFVCLVDREVERMGKRQDFLKVAIPQAILNPAIGKSLDLTDEARASIVQRLKRCKQVELWGEGQLETLADLIDALSFTYGFFRPVLLGEDPLLARKMAGTIARTLVRTLQTSAA